MPPTPVSFDRTVLTMRPSRHWRFDGSSSDQVTGQAPTYVGSVPFTSSSGAMFNELGSGGQGVGGAAASLNGTSQYINVGQGGRFAVRRGASWSIAIVFKLATNSTARQCLIGAKGGGNADGGNPGEWFEITLSGNKFSFNSANTMGLMSTTSGGNHYWVDWLTGTDHLQAGRWHTLVVTWDALNKLTMQLDGEIYAVNSSDVTGTLDSPSAAMASSLFVGARNNNGTADYFLSGSIASLTIWDRALSAEEARMVCHAQNGDSDTFIQFADTLAPIVAAATSARIAVSNSMGDSNSQRRTGEPDNSIAPTTNDGYTGGHPTGVLNALARRVGICATRPFLLATTGGGWDFPLDGVDPGVGGAIATVANASLPTFVKNRVARALTIASCPFQPAIMGSADAVANNVVGTAFINPFHPDQKIDMNAAAGSVLHYCYYGTTAAGTNGWFHIRCVLEHNGVIGAEIVGVRIQTATVGGITPPAGAEVSGADFLARGELVIPQQTLVPGDRIRIDMIQNGVEGAHGPGGLVYMTLGQGTAVKFGCSVGQFQAEGGRSLRYILARVLSTAAPGAPDTETVALTTQLAATEYYTQLLRPVVQGGFPITGFGIINQLGNDFADANYSLKQDGTGDSTKLANTVDGMYQDLLTGLMWHWTAIEAAGGDRRKFPFIVVYQGKESQLPQYRSVCLYAARLLARDLALGNVSGANGGRLAVVNAECVQGLAEETGSGRLNAYAADNPHGRRGMYIKTWEQILTELLAQASSGGAGHRMLGVGF